MTTWEYEDRKSEGFMVSRLEAAFSLGHLIDAQIQGLLTGDTPVVGLLAHFVVLQSGFVVDRQPLDGVCGQRLEGQEDKV